MQRYVDAEGWPIRCSGDAEDRAIGIDHRNGEVHILAERLADLRSCGKSDVKRVGDYDLNFVLRKLTISTGNRREPIVTGIVNQNKSALPVAEGAVRRTVI